MTLEGRKSCVIIALSIYCVWNLRWIQGMQKTHIKNTNHFRPQRITVKHWETALKDNSSKHAEIRNWIALWRQMPQAIVKVLFNLCSKCTHLSWHIFYFFSSMCNGQISLVTFPIILNASNHDLINIVPWLSNLKIKNLRNSISKFEIIPDSFLFRNEYKYSQPTISVFIIQSECGTGLESRSCATVPGSHPLVWQKFHFFMSCHIGQETLRQRRNGKEIKFMFLWKIKFQI